jgi:hypothetical protein
MSIRSILIVAIAIATLGIQVGPGVPTRRVLPRHRK